MGEKSWNCDITTSLLRFIQYSPNPDSFSPKPFAMGVNEKNSFANVFQSSSIQDSPNKRGRESTVADLYNQYRTNCRQAMKEMMQVRRDKFALMHH
mmetsp:Transcript_291/g.2339  ORF Transcript_291/g.2339 Transcript_291/m.2339 type:complete len:96 (+) Transcript_291:4937-5224(+)